EAQRRKLRVGEALASIGRGRPLEERRVAARFDPGRAQGREARADVDPRVRVRVRAAGVVDVYRWVRLRSEGRGRGRLLDDPHRHANVGARALDVDLARARQRLDGSVVHVGGRGEEFGFGVHYGSSRGARSVKAVASTLPTPA